MIFIEKKIYMYSIADTILQTDRGIVFVGQHEKITILSKCLLN